jgi:hypothetical protein
MSVCQVQRLAFLCPDDQSFMMQSAMNGGCLISERLYHSACRDNTMCMFLLPGSHSFPSFSQLCSQSAPAL